MVIILWKVGYVLGAFVTPICFQMLTCACNPSVIVACRTLINWKHAQYQSWTEVESLHHSFPTWWALSLQRKFYSCSETLTHKGSSHHSMMCVPFPFPQNPFVFFPSWLCGFNPKDYDIDNFPNIGPLPNQI